MQDSEVSNVSLRPLWIAILLNLIWVNLSGVIRAFAFVMPMMRSALPTVPDVVPMNLNLFLAWGAWELIPILSVSIISWLMMIRFGASTGIALAAGTVTWILVYANLWSALYLMNLATLSVTGVALALSWLEMAVAAFLVRWSAIRYS
ncbi:hypothetical protein [Ostreiculturibacter nitratireducens]|uniref:hypothetical protein n=1 Tax=Ostreiculturibacter nitratireducens TaxID=3075226 RepID=UPI0031B58946